MMNLEITITIIVDTSINTKIRSTKNMKRTYIYIDVDDYIIINKPSWKYDMSFSEFEISFLKQVDNVKILKWK